MVLLCEGRDDELDVVTTMRLVFRVAPRWEVRRGVRCPPQRFTRSGMKVMKRRCIVRLMENVLINLLHGRRKNVKMVKRR